MAGFRSGRILLLVCLASVAVSQEASETPIEVSSDSTQNLLTRKVPPVYPPLARQARIQGTVILNVIITKTGDIGAVRLVSGHPMLAPAAIEAVRQWRYQPYLVNGEPTEVATNLQIHFTLADNPLPGGGAVATTGVEAGATGKVADGLARVSEPVMRGLRTQKIDPVYPSAAFEAAAQGGVVMVVQIDRDGNVADISSVSGHPLLVQAAIDAVKQWKYRPYLRNGTPTDVKTTVHLRFELTGGGTVIEPEAPMTEPSSDVDPDTPEPGYPKRVRISQGIATVLVVDKVQPEYPPDAREQHIQGNVLLHVIIGKEGNVENLQLISGHPLLAAAAIDAVRQWKYRPYLLNGQAVEIDTQVLVNFKLLS
jgi:TonB family protein